MVTKRLFGQDPIKIGMVCMHADIVAQSKHQSPQHYLVKVRSIVVDDTGTIRVGCSFPLGNATGIADADGYDLACSLLTFPCHLKAV